MGQATAAYMEILAEELERSWVLKIMVTAAAASLVILAITIANRHELREFFDDEDFVVITLNNAAPYDVRFAYGSKGGDKKTKVEGWIILGPGQSCQRVVSVLEEKPEVHFYGESAPMTSNFRRAYPDNWPNGCAILTNQTTNHDRHHVDLHDDFILVESELGEGSTLEELVFQPVTPVKTDRNLRAVSYTVLDPTFEHINANVGTVNPELEDEQSMLNARQFASALENQERMASIGYRSHYPFILAPTLSDLNGSRRRGVAIERAFPLSISGQPSPIVEGDVIVSINGQDVYGVEDLSYLVDAHARNYDKGIEQLIQVEFERGNQLCHVGMTYFFNPSFYGITTKDKFTAFVRGGSDALTAGYDDAIAGQLPKLANAGKTALNWGSRMLTEIFETELGSLKIEEVDSAIIQWKYRQETARLIQFYPKHFGWGQIIGMFVPSPAKITMVSGITRIGGRSVRGGMGRFATIFGAELVEGAAWSHNTIPPDYPEDQVFERMKNDARMNAGMGIAFHVILSLRNK